MKNKHYRLQHKYAQNKFRITDKLLLSVIRDANTMRSAPGLVITFKDKSRLGVMPFKKLNKSYIIRDLSMFGVHLTPDNNRVCGFMCTDKIYKYWAVVSFDAVYPMIQKPYFEDALNE